jgi:hypothetical protein
MRKMSDPVPAKLLIDLGTTTLPLFLMNVFAECMSSVPTSEDAEIPSHYGLNDISQYRLLFGFSLLYTDRVPFELLDSAALLRREICGGGGQIAFLNLTTII